MFRVLYDLSLIVVALLMIPKVLWERKKRGKYKDSLASKFRVILPDLKLREDDAVIWIHAVSVGETKAAASLFGLLKEQYPRAKIVVSSTTETGQAEAKKSMSSANGYFYLPFDFSWNARTLIRKLHPKVVIFVESDFWYNTLYYAKKSGAAIFLVNGKISETSFQRFKNFPILCKRMFPLFDALYVQSERYLKRFVTLGVDADRIQSVGNLKLDVPIHLLDDQEKTEFRSKLGIRSIDPVIVIGSSHEPEEEQILSALAPVWKLYPLLKVLVVPRHPERFQAVLQKVKEMHIKVIPYSQVGSRKGDESVIVVDTMGLLMQCYQIATIAIVAGSFTEKVGGHNIFEPIQVGVPVLFGPYMHTQQDLTDLVLSSHAGRQVTTQALGSLVSELLKNPEQLESLKNKGSLLLSHVQGAAELTCRQINLQISKRNIEL